MDFSHYNDPARAQAIYNEYSADIERLGLQARAEAIVLSRKDCKGLDIALDKLASNGAKNHKTPGKNRSWY
jgi:hypothetical protein